MRHIRQITWQSDQQGNAFFPGLAKPVVIDPASLGEEQAAHLEKLAEAACFFEQPPEVGTPQKGAADYRCEVLAIDNGEVTHTVRALIPIADPALRALFDAIKAMRQKKG